MRNLLILFAFVFFISFASAQEFPSHYDAYVNDFANIFSAEETEYLRYLLHTLKENTTAEVVVVSVNSAEPYTPAEYRTRLFNEWGIGDEEKDNGLLILYAVTERRIEVEVGYGLEGILPDSKVGRLLDENYVPLRDEGNVTEGIILFTERIVEEVELNKEEVMAERKEDFSAAIFLFFVFIILLAVGVLFYAGTDRRRKGFGDFATFFIIDFVLRIALAVLMSRGGGRGYGGYGGGGFGGGSSGGGGAGR